MGWVISTGSALAHHVEIMEKHRIPSLQATPDQLLLFIPTEAQCSLGISGNSPLGTVTASHQRLHGPELPTWFLILSSVGLDGTHSGPFPVQGWSANTHVPLRSSPLVSRYLFNPVTAWDAGTGNSTAKLSPKSRSYEHWIPPPQDCRKPPSQGDQASWDLILSIRGQSEVMVHTGGCWDCQAFLRLLLHSVRLNPALTFRDLSPSLKMPFPVQAPAWAGTLFLSSTPYVTLWISGRCWQTGLGPSSQITLSFSAQIRIIQPKSVCIRST